MEETKMKYADSLTVVEMKKAYNSDKRKLVLTAGMRVNDVAYRAWKTKGKYFATASSHQDGLRLIVALTLEDFKGLKGLHKKYEEVELYGAFSTIIRRLAIDQEADRRYLQALACAEVSAIII
jgi:hypothetical protein